MKLMEQQCDQIIDLKKIQTQFSRYRGGLHLVRIRQANQYNLVRFQSPQYLSQDYDLQSIYELLQTLQTSIAQDIVELEVLLAQSAPRQGDGLRPAKHKSDAIAINALSCKESEVLNMFAKGYSYNEVADLLGCKLATVQTHTKRIYKKLRVHSRSEAIYEARQLDLIIV